MPTQSYKTLPRDISRKKKTSVFKALTFYPKQAQKSFRTPFTTSTWAKDALANNTKSFAKNKCNSRGPVLDNSGGIHKLELIAYWIPWDCRSIHNTNK